MKVFVQIIDTKTGIYQTGMIDEPVIKGMEVNNALKHFGVMSDEVEWTDSKLFKTGVIKDTTKIVSVYKVVYDQPTD